MKLDELVKVYCSLSALMPETEQGYLDAARKIGNPHIEDLTMATLQQTRARSQSPYSWNSLLGKLRATIRFAVRSGWTSEDHPVFRVKRLQTGPVVRQEITEHDRKALLDVINQSENFAPSWYWKTMFDVLYYSGIRRKQLCHLRWADLDLNASTILLRAAGAKNKRERLLPLHDRLSKLLTIYKKRVEKSRGNLPLDSSTQVFRMEFNDGDLQAGKDLTPEIVTAFFYSLSKESGFHVTAHLLRHSFATKISRDIPNIRMVQLLLNHDRVETTMRYIHPTMDDMRNVMSLPLTSD